MSDLFSVTVPIGIFASGIRLATPYLYAALGETFGQKSGVLNLGVEGVMLLGAFTSFYVTFTTGNYWLGLLAAIITGIVLGVVTAVINVTLKAQQGISGIGIYLFGLGMSDLLFQKTMGTVETVKGFSPVHIPIDAVFSSLSWTLAAQVEELTLVGDGALHGTGNDLANRLLGNGASNRLYGLAGDDWLDGGMAEDVLVGGAGDDTYVADLPADKVVELADEGSDTVLAAMNFSLREHVENLVLTGERDSHGRGNELGNRLTGNSGDNVLEGRAGNDVLSGGAGNDRLEGGAGDDLYLFERGTGWDKSPCLCSCHRMS